VCWGVNGVHLPMQTWNRPGRGAILDLLDPAPTGDRMHQSLEAVQAAALELSDEDRAELAQRLLASLDRDPEVVAAWDHEIKRRIAEVEAGLVVTIPAEEVFSNARNQLKT
jgi:putative addiction module component (TIGR02574 family)